MIIPVLELHSNVFSLLCLRMMSDLRTYRAGLKFNHQRLELVDFML
ncbi:MAG: hypothetical protein ANABAC_2781 [Anaerolineae bacterium]|nr:MAG: hypothetical protein ANABAC_2781 [Anaerolineae bacterium]